MEHVLAALDRTLNDIATMAEEGANTDGGHHKQWYLEQILILLGKPMPDDEQEGIPA